MRVCLMMMLLLPATLFAQTYELSSSHSGTNTSIRGLSVVSDSVAWVSGSNGMIGKTIDGGKVWKWNKPEGFETIDFRDIEAFDEKRAVVMSSGAPSYILRTDDGGSTWHTSYKNIDTAMFLDGIAFWSESRGIAFGDPIDNQMQLLETQDGGLSWKDISANMPLTMAKGEAGFAASGTSIKALPGGKAWIATGGTKSSIYKTDDYGQSWKRFDCPIIHGNSSSGAFSLDFYTPDQGIVVGGNYLQDKDNSNNVLITKDGGESWTKPFRPVHGYRSGVVWFNAEVCFATGTSGTDVSRNGGMNWYHISDESFNAIQRAKNGKLIVLAGNKGQIYTLKIK